MGLIRFENVSKAYKKDNIIKGINLTINRNECIAVIGPSGCGKTTLIKMINGMIEDYEGNIFYMDRELRKWDKIDLRRKIGYVIQNVGLFPHRTVKDNIGYVLEINKVNKVKREEVAEELIDTVGLNQKFLSKYPRELSGGEKQRVGVARALAGNPDLVLMDEPFGAVDEINRKILQDEIIRIQKELNKTIIFVTHDIDEAFKVGDRIILFNEGEIVQDGTKEEMLFNPQNDFVREFFGLKNFTSYLSQTNIMDYVVKNGYAEHKHILSSELSIMDGLRAVFETGDNEIAIKNEDGRIVGSFSLDVLKKNFGKI